MPAQYILTAHIVVKRDSAYLFAGIVDVYFYGFALEHPGYPQGMGADGSNIPRSNKSIIDSRKKW